MRLARRSRLSRKPFGHFVVDAFGGLGNQLFQFAFALGLNEVLRPASIRLRTPLSNDGASGATNLSSSHSECLGPLEALALPIPSARSAPLSSSGPAPTHPLGSQSWKIVKETGFDYQRLHIPRGANVRFKGYWQSPRYFRPIEDLLRTTLLDAILAEFGAEPPILDEIAVHVRRGDYVQDESTQDFHGILGADYYLKALQTVDPTGMMPVRIFSDDNEEAEELLSACGRPFVIDTVSTSAIAVIGNLARHRHIVIANSSLSWWGAWLAGPTATVVAPRRWFASTPTSPASRFPRAWLLR